MKKIGTEQNGVKIRTSHPLLVSMGIAGILMMGTIFLPDLLFRPVGYQTLQASEDVASVTIAVTEPDAGETSFGKGQSVVVSVMTFTYLSPEIISDYRLDVNGAEIEQDEVDWVEFKMSHSDVTVQYQADYFIGKGSFFDKRTVQSNEVNIGLKPQLVKYRLTLSGDPGGLVYPYTGDGWHDAEAKVTIVAVALWKDGFTFKGWSDPEGTPEGLGSPDIEVIMNKDISLHATFELLPPKEE